MNIPDMNSADLNDIYRLLQNIVRIGKVTMIDADNLPLQEEIARIVEGRDIVDPVRAKLHKAMGRACEASGRDQSDS